VRAVVLRPSTRANSNAPSGPGEMEMSVAAVPGATEGRHRPSDSGLQRIQQSPGRHTDNRTSMGHLLGREHT
jgi:hypothetical protein